MDDKNLVLCGVEEPVRANRYLSSFDPTTNDFNEADFSVPGLNRYSLVFRDDTNPAEAEARIARFLIQNSGPAFWISAWDVPTAADPGQRGSPILLRWTQQTTQDRIEQGWHFCTEPVDAVTTCAAIQIATLPANGNNISGFAPKGYSSPYTKFRIILALCLDQNPCKYVHEKLTSEIKFMNTKGSFHPSRALLTWMAEANIELAFPRQSTTDILGIVVLRPLPYSLDDLEQMGVTEVRDGDSAQTVWNG